MEKHYDLKITQKALQYIIEKMASLVKTDYGLVILNKGTTGCGYYLQILKIQTIKTTASYHQIFPAEYKNFGFPIYAEGLLLLENSFPNSFVIDLITKSDGIEILDIKNPEFETYEDK